MVACSCKELDSVVQMVLSIWTTVLLSMLNSILGKAIAIFNILLPRSFWYLLRERQSVNVMVLITVSHWSALLLYLSLIVQISGDRMPCPTITCVGLRQSYHGFTLSSCAALMPWAMNCPGLVGCCTALAPRAAAGNGNQRRAGDPRT